MSAVANSRVRNPRGSSFSIAMACAMLAVPAWGAEDPGALVLRQHLLQRQQQQEVLHLRMQQQQEMLQLRMQQQQLSFTPAPADPQQGLALDRVQTDQRQRLDQSHYRQAIAPAPALPSDDESTRRVKAELARAQARQ